VKACVDRDITLDVGTGQLLDDGCSVCDCTSQGLLCNSAACDWRRACQELTDEYAMAVGVAARCDPKSTAPTCTERVPADLGCSIQVPVNDSGPVDAVDRMVFELGCPVGMRICIPAAGSGSHAACLPEGTCGYVP
jgi:hypothetical protein